MAQIRDLDAGKIYIGQENPKLDRSLETLDGDKEYEGTLAVTGPTFIGGHSTNAAGVLNVGTALGTFSPNTDGRAVDIEGDVNIVGEKAVNTVFIDGDVFVTGSVDCLSKGRLEARHAVADSLPKPFDMVHPSRGDGYRLRYACIEGPEVGVYFRGRTQDNEIVLPDYWKDLVVIDSITVQTQPVGSTQSIIVKEWDDSKITLEGVTDCFYHVYAERKDVNPLVVEYEGETWQDYPDPKYDDPSYAR
tara:strand:+ start:16 stop:756 length:741 start_codon:yes stop_codon:yes gene_type:complete